jgi:hypothetical protein
MNQFFLERKGVWMIFLILISARSLAATSVRHALAKHRQPPSATALHMPPAASPLNSIQATM